jgi:hypothetical protein
MTKITNKINLKDKCVLREKDIFEEKGKVNHVQTYAGLLAAALRRNACAPFIHPEQRIEEVRKASSGW